MSGNSVEAFLYEVSANKQVRIAFGSDPAALLAASGLSEEECRCVRELDLGALLGMGVNPMMLQGFWVAIRGRASFVEFVTRINALKVGHG